MSLMKTAMLGLSLVFLLTGASLFCQDADKKAVQIVTYWEPGDSHSYKLEMGTEMSLTAGETRSYTSYRVLLEVLDWNDEGYLIRWTYSDAVPPQGADAFEKRMVAINEGLAVLYRISDLGEFIGVENWEEIAAHVDRELALIVEEYAGQPGIESSAAAIMKAFESRERFEELAMEEIRFYHMLHGYTYLMDDPLIAEGAADNPFGGAPVLSKTTIELSTVNSENNTAYLIYTRTFDQASLERAVFEAMNGYLPERELTQEEIAGLPVFDMLIKKQFIFHTATGWLLEAY